MLYNFINSIFIFTFFSLEIGAALLLFSNFIDNYGNSILRKCEKTFLIIGNVLLAIGSVSFASTLPIKALNITHADILFNQIAILIIFIFLAFIVGICIITYLTYPKDMRKKTNTKKRLGITIPIIVPILQITFFVISTITFSILLYPDYKITEIIQENTPISEETRKLTSFNDIPLANTLEDIHMALGFGEGKISTSDYVTYWYINEHGDVLYDKAPAYESVKRVAEDNNYHLTITTYATVTKRNTKHKELQDLQKDKRTVYVFYLPKELVGTIN